MSVKLRKRFFKFLWKNIESHVDAHITGRILLFHDALVDRKQILPTPKPSGIVKENKYV